MTEQANDEMCIMISLQNCRDFCICIRIEIHNHSICVMSLHVCHQIDFYCKEWSLGVNM